MIRLTALAALLAATLSTTALAGEQYLDKTGLAVSGYDVVSYFGLKQSKVGSAQPAPEPGRSDITAGYNGATFAFSTVANRDKFLANPEAFAPQYDGHCAYGVAQGGKVPGNPTLWRIVDGKLYLNITKNVVGFWEENIPGNINLAEGNWGGLEPQGAATSKIPNFTSAAPVSN